MKRTNPLATLLFGAFGVFGAFGALGCSEDPARAVVENRYPESSTDAVVIAAV